MGIQKAEEKFYAWWNPLGMIQKRWICVGVGVAGCLLVEYLVLPFFFHK